MKNFRLAFFYFFAYLSLGCILSQLIPMLNQEFNLFIKTCILGGSALLAFLLSLGLGLLSDSCQKMKPSFYISMCLYVGSVCGIFVFDFFIFKLISYLFLIAASKMVMSSCETILLFEKKEKFGKYHCIGVVGLVIGSWLTNYIPDKLLWMSVSSFGMLSCLFAYSYQEKPKEKRKIEIQEIIVLLKDKTYLFLLIIFFFLMMMGFADQYVVVEKMISLDTSKLIISLKYSLQALMEIPIYLLMSKLFKKISISFLLYFCILMSALKFLLYGMASTSLLILFISSLQIFTHPLIVLLSKKLILKNTPPDLMASSQIIGFAIYNGLSGFIASVLGNVLSHQFSYDIALYIFSLTAIIPCLIWHKTKNMIKY